MLTPQFVYDTLTSDTFGYLYVPLERTYSLVYHYIENPILVDLVGTVLAWMWILHPASQFSMYILVGLYGLSPCTLLVVMGVCLLPLVREWTKQYMGHADTVDEVLETWRHYENHVYDQNGYYSLYGTTPLEDYLFYGVWGRSFSEEYPILQSRYLYSNLIVAPLCEEVATRGVTSLSIWIIWKLVPFIKGYTLAEGSCLATILFLPVLDMFVFASQHNRMWLLHNALYAKDWEKHAHLFLATLEMALLQWLVILCVQPSSIFSILTLCIYQHSFRNWASCMARRESSRFDVARIIPLGVFRVVAEQRYQRSWVPQKAPRYASVRSLIHAIGHGRRGETACATRRRRQRIKKKMWRIQGK